MPAPVFEGAGGWIGCEGQFDRIARHQGDAFTIRERITFAGARVFALSDGEVTDITATFRGLMDAQFRRDLAAKIKRGQRGTISQKRSAAGLAYGYRKANRFDDRGELIRGLHEVDEEQVKVVRRIFEEFAAGQSPRAIAEGLNRDGVESPSGRLSGPRFWRASTIYGDRKRKNGILQNKLYIGQLVFNRTRKVLDPRTRTHLIRANPESDWLVEKVPELRIIDDDLWERVQQVLGRVQSRAPQSNRRPKHILSGLVACGLCGGGWVIHSGNRWGCSRHKEGGKHACPNNRIITTDRLETRVLHGLQHYMLNEKLIEIYVEEYHGEFAKRTKELRCEEDRLKKRHGDAVAKIERLVEAVANGAEDFIEIRDVLARARTDRDRFAEQISQLQQLPAVALHPAIIADYRRQVAKLNAALGENPDARFEAIPKLRALINQVRVSPTEQEKGVTIEVIGRLTSIMALATGEQISSKQYFNVGAGEGIRTLDPDLGKVVLYP